MDVADHASDNSGVDSDSEIYDDAEYHNYDHIPTSTEMDLHLIYYEWLVDSEATSHIIHTHNSAMYGLCICKSPCAMLPMHL